jgi:hypothetical protein
MDAKMLEQKIALADRDFRQAVVADNRNGWLEWDECQRPLATLGDQTGTVVIW